jgi:transposase
MKKNKEAEQMVKAKFIVLSPVMNELSRRRWAAAEARSLGYGGVSIVSRATGLSRTTITEGLVELSSKWQLTPTKVRHSGGGRKKISDEDRTVLAALEKLVNPMTRGDPMSPLQWTCKSTAKLARELNTQGHTISARTVARLLHDLDYSLQSNRKTKEGTQHPDRNAQFEFINKEAKKFQQRKQPVISVDTKKKELGKGLPYGVYDPARNQGWVSVGIDHDTAYFATATINRWWQVMGKKAYPDAKELLITADSGGSNGSRTRLWKVALQKLANEIGLKISVCHYPPGTSKWNKIEHRMFCHITGNWRGHPLASREVIVNLIANTTTTTGLSINAELDEASYATGIKVSDKELSTVRITKNKFHGDWNYKISPNLSN